MNFPTWLYHKTLPALIVHSEAELKALGAGWKDAPVEADAAEVEVVEEKPKPKAQRRKKGE